MSDAATVTYVQEPLTRATLPTVAGFTGVSKTAWPGRVAACVEVSGCNLRCPYCHCPELLGKKRPQIGIEHVVEALGADRDRIGGVVITGGEPTADSDLPDILRELTSLGLPLKLDTNGTFPAVLEEVLEARLVTFVALDVKTTPERYDAVTGGQHVWERVRRSIDLVLASGVDHEFRTTCYPSALHSADLPRIARSLEGGRRYAIQQFRPQRTLDPAAVSVRPLEADALRRAALCCAVHLPTVVRGV